MNLDDILRLVRPRSDDEQQTAAGKQEELLECLRAQQSATRVVLYASAYDRSSLFVHAVLVPASNYGGSWERLTEWSGNPFDSASCGLVYGGGEGPRIEMNSPWDERQPEALTAAKQVVFGAVLRGPYWRRNLLRTNARHHACAPAPLVRRAPGVVSLE